LKIVFGNLEEMLAELKEKEITEIRVDALFQERGVNQGLVVFKAFVTVGAILENASVGHFEKVIFKNLRPFRNEEVEQIIRDTLKAENEIKQSLAAENFTVRNGYFAEAVS